MVKTNEGEYVEIGCNLVLGYGQANVDNEIWWRQLIDSEVII